MEETLDKRLLEELILDPGKPPERKLFVGIDLTCCDLNSPPQVLSPKASDRRLVMFSNMGNTLEFVGVPPNSLSTPTVYHVS